MQVITYVIYGVVAVLLVAVWRRVRQRRKYYGPAAVGMFDELLIKDRQRATEIIVEEKAEATDPETADGDLPQLENPGKR